jgi:hypothetical protein
MKKIILLLIIAIVLIGTCCKKKSAASAEIDPRIPPDMTFKTGGNYTSRDTIVSKQDALLIGIIVTKTEDNLTSFNASASYDGSITTTTFFNHHLSSSEYGGYIVDVPYYVRNQTGTEVLTFTIVDRDGNITKKTITVTVI